MYKVNKKMKTNNLEDLHSEIEDRGRGQRIKNKQHKFESEELVSSDDDIDIEVEKSVKKSIQNYPEFPKKQKGNNYIKNNIIKYI